MKAAMTKAILLVIVAIPLFVMSAHPAEIEGVVFQDSITVHSQKLSLRGTGLFRYLHFIKAYVGALYLPQDISAAEVLLDIHSDLKSLIFIP